ncbi:MAG: sugar-binding transcriptional regulator [Pontibacterium sp.]
MTRQNDLISSDIQLITDVAVRYYVENETQEQIAQALDISRPRVSRLLKRATDEGIVDIQVRNHSSVQSTYEKVLKERFKIDRAFIAIDTPDPEKQRANVAALAAKYLEDTLEDRMIVAVGMGRNVGAIPDNITQATPRRCTFVSSIGGSHRAGEVMNPDHICRRLATRFGGESETLYSPAYVDDTELRTHLLANPTIKQTLDAARRADLALIGIGDISEDSNLVRMGWFTPQEISHARLSGTIGDMMGYDFINIYGERSAVELQNHVIGLNINEVARIPNVVAVASESTKGAAILGALRTGAINTLITTTSNVLTLLQLDDATRNRP